MKDSQQTLRVLCSLWLAEFCTLLSESESFTIWVDAVCAVPQLSPSAALAHLRSRSSVRCVVNAHDGDRVISVGLFECRSGALRADEATLFLPEGKMSGISDMTYLKPIHSMLGSKHSYLSGEGVLLSMDFEGLRIVPKKGSERVLIGTPIHERYEITRVFLEYMNRYFIPSLLWKGYDVVLALCGAQTDHENISHLIDCKLNFFSAHDNILGEKKNKLLQIARGADADFILWVDSDDFFHPDTALDLIDTAGSNGYWSSLSPFAFFDTLSGALTKYPGYAPNSDLAAYGMGSGRVFTREAILALGDSPFPARNKSMDHGTRVCLDAFRVPREARLLKDLVHLPIGVKSDQNLWSFKDYNGAEGSWGDSQLAWVPKPVLDQILALTREAPGNKR